MTRLANICLGIFILAAFVLLTLRQRTLNELRAGNEILRQQLSTATSTNELAQVPQAGVTNSATSLTARERAELLRLRGQVGLLRRELRTLSNKGPARP